MICKTRFLMFAKSRHYTYAIFYYKIVVLQKTRQRPGRDGLDVALHELGMLSAITEARREFLRETRCGLLRIDRRYVSDVAVGYCMRRPRARTRLFPYVTPARHRTKSENSDVNIDIDTRDTNKLFEPSTSGCSRKEFGDSVSDVIKFPNKRCQSLEYLNLSIDSQRDIEVSPEMECVSTRIQKLQVEE